MPKSAMMVQPYSAAPRLTRSPSRESSAPAPRLTPDRSTSSSELRDQYTKRSSIFSKRPKSILTTSSHDSARSHASISSGSDVSWKSSIGDASALAPSLESSRARSLFGRNRKSKVSNTRPFRAPSPVDAEDELDQQEGVEHQAHGQGNRIRISAPFGFQHITKMEGQPAAIAEESDEVFDNFRTLRKGHRHAVIASIDFENPENGDMNKQRKPPPLRPQRPDDLWGEHPGSAPLLSAPRLYPSASLIGDFQQAKSADLSGYNPVNRRSPPRSSSSLSQVFQYGPGPVLEEEPELHSSDAFEDGEPFAPLYDTQPPGWIETSLPLLHTVSPIDTTSDYVRTPVYSQPLELVPEEPEGTFSNRQSRELTKRPSLRHSKSSPAVATRYKPTIESISAEESTLPSIPKHHQRRLSQCSESSDTLGNPLQSLWHESKSCSNLQDMLKSEQTIDDVTWEDDIDYCYEHNAEADCDYDWRGISHYDDQDSDDSQSCYEQRSSCNSSFQPKHEQRESVLDLSNLDSFPHPNSSNRIPSNSSVPELDYRHSHSASTVSMGIATPRDGSLYQSSDSVPHFDITQMQISKDSILARCTSAELQNAPEHLYNEIMIARNVDSATPEVPSAHDDNKQTITYNGPGFRERYLGALPTPPLSGKYKPDLPEAASDDRSENITPTQQPDAETARRVPLPASPEPDSLHNDEAPQLVSRNYIGLQNAAKLRLLEAQSRLQNLAPTSMPHNVSSESLNAGVQYSKLPTPPYTPSPTEMVNSRTFLATPSPNLLPVQSPVYQIPRSPSLNSLNSTRFLPSSEHNRSTPPVAGTRTIPRHRAESAAGRLGVLPSPAASFIEKPGTPDSSVAASVASSPGRMGYSLFPSRQAPTPHEKAESVTDLPIMAPPPPVPTSAPKTSHAPTPSIMSEASTRPGSRAGSLTSSHSHTSSQVSTQPTSRSRSDSRSLKSAKTPKKPNKYQTRYPLGI